MLLVSRARLVLLERLSLIPRTRSGVRDSSWPASPAGARPRVGVP